MTRLPIEAELRRRAVPIAGTYNFRDTGGYETVDGRSTRWGRLFRSDGLHRLELAAMADLTELGIRTVVDLRSDAERTAYPDVLPAGVELVGCPLLDEARLDPAPTTLSDVYNYLVDERGASLVAAIRPLAASSGLPAVVHCAAGKDRTGVVVGLVLSSVGVADDVVASDFAATELFMSAEFLSALNGSAPNRVDAALLGADAQLMLDLLGRVREAHGGAREFLLAHGLHADEHARLRAQLVDGDVG